MPSALEMVEEMLGEDEGVGPRADALLRPLPEAPASPLLKAHLVVIKKIKVQKPWAPQGEELPPPQAVENTIIHPYTQDEFVDMSIQYRQKPSEPLPTWLLRL